MKPHLGLACLSLLTILQWSACIFAAPTATAATYEQNRIDTLHFRTAQGMLSTNLGVSTRLHETETDTTDGSPNATIQRTSWNGSLDLNYGLADLIAVGVTESYLFGLGTVTTSEPGGSVTRTSARGLSNPTFHTSWRYWGGLHGAEFGQLHLTYAPALIRHQNSEPSSPGNGASSTTALSLGTNFYWVEGIHEWSVQPSIHYMTTATAGGAVATNVIKTEAFFTYNLLLAFRAHFADDWFGGISANISAPYRTRSAFIERSPPAEQASFNSLSVSPTLTLGWRAAPALAVDLNFAYTQSSRTTTPLNDGSSFAERDIVIEQELMSLNATYAF